MAVVKANAYGHGMHAVARCLDQADALAVARLDEALSLREAGISQDIVVLSPLADTEELKACARHRLQPVLHGMEAVSRLARLRSLPLPLKVWLKVDSGMRRLGLDGSQLPEGYGLLRKAKAVELVGIMTHLASAEIPDDQPTTRQLEVFDQLVRNLELPVSIANSAAILRWPQSRRGWVRPGLMLYGVDPADQPRPAVTPPLPDQDIAALRPAMELSAPLIAIRQVSAGSRVGYGGHWQASRRTWVGAVAIGYADGYPRHAPNGTPAMMDQGPVRLAGRVSMNLLTLDLGPRRQHRLGDQVVLWGKAPQVDDIARRCGTIAYELLSRVDRNLHREYLDD